MKKVYLCALLLGVLGVSANASEIDTDHLMFPEDVAEAIAEARLALETTNVRTADQNDYAEDKAWVGATKVEADNQNQQNHKQLVEE